MEKVICNICYKQYSPKYMIQHTKTFLHIENSSFEYFSDKNVK